MKEILLDGSSLTIADVVAVAYGKPETPRVSLSEVARVKVARAAAAVETLVGSGEVAYGITTGFGAFKSKVISRDETLELQRNILISHAVGLGERLDVPTVRAAILIRANTLARGHSGITVDTLETLIAFLNTGLHPVTPSKGSLGASGDLAPLAHIALPLIGEGEAEIGGEIVSGAEAMKRAGLSILTLKAKEGLALTNGTSVMAAIGVLEVAGARKLVGLAEIAACLSLEALNGTDAAFDERIHELRPHSDQILSASNLRRILKGSELVRTPDASNIQDAYTLRCIPQVSGAVRGAVSYAEGIMETEINSVTDNPLIFINQSGAVEVVSGGNFHGEPLALAMDHLALALTELGNISERRIMRLTDSDANGGVLPAFLTRNGGLNSGFMIVQYTAAALCTENKVLSHPASADTIPSSMNVEDHVSMGMTAGIKLKTVSANVADVIALELLCAAQGVDFRRADGEARLGEGTADMYDSIRRVVPFIEKDVALKPHIEAIRTLVTVAMNS